MKQTEKGKAFEYACLSAFEDYLKNYLSQSVIVEDNFAFQVAKQVFENLSSNEQVYMKKAGLAAAKIITDCEPHLVCKNHKSEIILTLQEDAAGQHGDVRDMLAIRILDPETKWEIGVSCKHNHSAVKHSRLSHRLDFGKEWLDIPCSQQYFSEIQRVFSRIEEYKKEKRLWRNIEKKEKEEEIYLLLLRAFIDELKRIAEKCKDEEEPVPARLIRYLIGRHDFYKVISIKKIRNTQVQAFNLNGSLNLPCCHNKPKIRIGAKLKLPTKFVHIGLKENSRNTAEVICNNGWTVSFRIHNASSKIESSLKFDIQLIGHPQELFSHFERWD